MRPFLSNINLALSPSARVQNACAQILPVEIHEEELPSRPYYRACRDAASFCRIGGDCEACKAVTSQRRKPGAVKLWHNDLSY